MEANKAPEKIYLYPSNIPDQEYEAEWGCQPWDENSVEYTRTDVFIDKAAVWLRMTMDFFNNGEFNTEKFVNDFKREMKGE